MPVLFTGDTLHFSNEPPIQVALIKRRNNFKNVIQMSSAFISYLGEIVYIFGEGLQ